MSIIIPANSAVAGGYDVENSCRFNSGDSATLVRTQGTATNLKKFVWSCWMKRSKLGAGQYIVQNYNSGTDQAFFYLRGTDDLRFFNRSGGADTVWISDTILTDAAAWYHILIKVDTTQGTDTNRLKIFINGVQDTGNGITYPGLNADMAFNTASASNRHSLASTGGGSNFVGGYLSEIVLIDGTSPDYTDFGEFDEDSGIWKPIDVSGLTFGNNGYYLDFQDSANLGNDASGGTDFTETNILAIDQSIDTCTNNFAVMNINDNYYANATLTEGNLKVATGSGREASNTATVPLSSGKWFWEYKQGSGSPNSGIQPVPSFGNTASNAGLQINGVAYLTTGKVETSNGSGGSNVLATYSTFTTNDIIGTALDLNASKIYFYKNGTVQDASGLTITAASATTNGHYLIGFAAIAGTTSFEINFGGTNTYAVSSGNADGNGYGNFEYAVPSGFFSICTKNLSEALS